MMLSHSTQFDRFIPNRSQTLLQSHECRKNTSSYDNYLLKNLCPQSRVLTFKNKENWEVNSLANGYQSMKSLKLSVSKPEKNEGLWGRNKNSYKKLRSCSEPEKILDVPSVRDDFYLNTLDWSPLGPLGISLDNEVYLYTPSNIMELCKVLDGSYVSSLKFFDQIITVGFSDGKIRIYDLETTSVIRQINEHSKRVSALTFSSKNILYSGSKDRNILVNDIRLKDSTTNRLMGHRGQICSLKCQPEMQNYLASGSNDNNVAIWDIRRHQLVKRYAQHKGAVKAISWCPWKSGVIATAGGAGDKSIRLWNINESEDLALKKTGSQISSLLWNQQTGLLISGHGYPDSTINFWKPEVFNNKALKLEKVKELKGHKGRILNLTMSPSQGAICSLSADETLRFWRFLDSEEDLWQEKQVIKANRWSFKLK